MVSCEYSNSSTSSCCFHSSKKYAWLQYKKPQIEAPGTTFSIFSDEVRLEEGDGNCCRFCHTHGSEPRSPYLPCQIMDQWKKSKLEQNHGISYRKKMGGSGASSCRFDQRFVFFKWQVASPTKKTILRTNPQLETPLPLYFSCTTFRIATTPATPSIHKCTTWRWTIRCSHYRL